MWGLGGRRCGIGLRGVKNCPKMARVGSRLKEGYSQGSEL